MKTTLMQFWQDEEGATAIEYGLIAGLIAVAIIGGLQLVEGGLTGLFTQIATELGDAAPT